ncbi:MAG: hypothetical protein WBE72_00600, partial [Terracidiphilus sp.]
IAATPGSYTGRFLKRYYTSENGRLAETEFAEDFAVDSEGDSATSQPAAERMESPAARRATTRRERELKAAPGRKKRGHE